jgi:stalled ribosome rescue protein Dom34
MTLFEIGNILSQLQRIGSDFISLSMHTIQDHLDDLSQTIDIDPLLVAFGPRPAIWAFRSSLARTLFITETAMYKNSKEIGYLQTKHMQKVRGARILIFNSADLGHDTIVNKGGICALLRQPIDARNKANKKR